MPDELNISQQETINLSKDSSKQVFAPETIPDQPFPAPIVASEVMGIVRDSAGNRVTDELGLVSTTQFEFQTLKSSGSQIVTAGSGSPVDVTDATFDMTLDRVANVLFLVSIRGYIEGQSPGDFSGNGIIAIKKGSETVVSADTLVVGGQGVGSDTNNTAVSSYTIHRILQLPAGTTTCKLISWVDQGGYGNCQLVITSYVYSYIQLGK